MECRQEQPNRDPDSARRFRARCDATRGRCQRHPAPERWRTMTKKWKRLVSQDSLATSRDRIKGKAAELSGGRFGFGLLHPLVSPAGPIFHDPIAERFFKADVSAGFFAFDPFVLQNFFPLGKELLVENRVFNELRLFAFGRRHVGTVFHIAARRSIKTIRAFPLGVAAGVPIQIWSWHSSLEPARPRAGGRSAAAPNGLRAGRLQL